MRSRLVVPEITFQSDFVDFLYTIFDFIRVKEIP